MLICFNVSGFSLGEDHNQIYLMHNSYILIWFVSVFQSFRKLLISLTWLDSLFLPRSLWFLWDLLVKGGLK